MKAVCSKCAKYKDCSEPCYPVKEYLALDNLSVFEKSFTKPSGEKISIVFAKGKREYSQSTLSIGLDDRQEDLRLSNKEQQAFSTENENPFSSFQPSLKQTGIFVDRFFNKFSYEDLATKYDMDKKNAIRTYHNALNRVIVVLEAMDQGTKTRKWIST